MKALGQCVMKLSHLQAILVPVTLKLDPRSPNVELDLQISVIYMR